MGAWRASVRMMAALALTVARALPAATAEPRPASIRDVAGVFDGLVLIDVGNAIRKGCPAIEANRLRGIMFMLDLKHRASLAGFADDEIRAFVDDPAEKSRVEAAADRWLSNRGARRDDPDSLCRVGGGEITAGSTLGRLLRMTQ